MGMDENSFVRSAEVLRAVSGRIPIVALESTIITHGMPYPENLKLAREVESIIRSYNCCPATIAVIGGKIHIGLENAQLEEMAKNGRSFKKMSRRDVACVIARKVDSVI